MSKGTFNGLHTPGQDDWSVKFSVGDLNLSEGGAQILVVALTDSELIVSFQASSSDFKVAEESELF